MSKIIEYKTLQALNFPDLDNLINIAILDGWQPYGNQYCEDSPAGFYHQPMVKYAEAIDVIGGEL